MSGMVSYPTLWPTGFDPDASSWPARAVVVDEVDRASMVGHFHTHRRGQLTVCVTGFVGMEFEEVTWTIPSRCAAWVPPGYPHCGRLSPHSISIYVMLDENVSAKLPTEPERFVLNPMTFEVVAHLAKMPRMATDLANALGFVLQEELLGAKRLPGLFAPMPKDPRLKAIGEGIMTYLQDSNEALASQLHMSEKTLSRLVKQETGLTLKTWRLHLTLTHALSLLVEGVPIDKIAHEVGYETTSAFIAAFKRVFGVTPGKYRTNARSHL